MIAVVMVSAAWACGGPERYALYEPLAPASELTNGWLRPWDGYEETPRDEVRFLYPLHASDPATYADLWAFQYGGTVAPAVPGGFADAVRKGELAFMEDAAKKAVKAALDRPAGLAGDDDELRAAVEFLELAPLLPTLPKTEVQAYFSGGAPRSPVLVQAAAVRGISPEDAAKLLKGSPKHPRRASLRLRVLQGAMKAGIPDGWSVDEIRPKLPAKDPLFAQVDSWLADFGTHPLADYVRLYRLRLHYLHGDAEAAWKLLLAEQPKHPARIAGEMAFLVRNGMSPPKGLVTTQLPGDLAAALLREVPVDGEEWSDWWRFSEAHGKEAWALPMQEVLLQKLASDGITTLPEAFPAKAAPTPSWALLRLAALADAGRVDEAWDQSALCKDGPIPAIRAGILLKKEDFVGAALEPGLDPNAQAYVIRVLAPEPALKQLRARGDAPVQEEARLALASRQAATGDWKNASKTMGASWAGVAKARKKAKDPLDWARYLQSRRGELFVGNDYEDVIWYRSLAGKSPAEIDWAKRSFEDWYALQAYADALDRASEAEVRKDPQRWRQILREADDSYNKLLNYGNGDWYLWGDVVVDSDAAKRVRKAGRTIRTVAK